MTIDEYIHFIAEIPPDEEKNIEGFTIGKGKKVYWYITPMPKSGRYRCLPIEKEHNSKLGWSRFVYPDQIVKIVKGE